MKKIVIFMLMCLTATITFSARKVDKNTKKPIVYTVYEGKYDRATNTFTYKKDNLIFPDKIKSYEIVDQNKSLDRIYTFLKSDYELKDNQVVEMEIVGRIESGKMLLWQVQNYRVPEENLKGRANYILFGQ